MRKADITAGLVSRLVGAQFPQWAGLPVRPVEAGGWDNVTFRLGEEMSVRLPSDATPRRAARASSQGEQPGRAARARRRVASR